MKERYTVNCNSVGKSSRLNEDRCGHNGATLVVVDGATDKSGQKWDQKTGGEIAAETVLNVCMNTDSKVVGQDLIAEINSALRKEYKRVGNHHAVNDKLYRFCAAFVCVRIWENGIYITQIGDVGYRLDLQEPRLNNKTVDYLSAMARSRYVDATADISGARDYIMPLLRHQFEYQNNPDHVLGYGFVDGWEIPAKFVMTEELDFFPTYVELFTDGYFGFPTISHEPTIRDWEDYREYVEQEDQFKLGKLLHSASTKIDDDRTILIAKSQ